MSSLHKLILEDLEDLSRGATFLGSGGGGDATADCLFAESFLEEKELPITPLLECPDDAMVVLVASIGAPLVSAEKLLSGHEWNHAIELLENAINKPIEYVVSAEIGGSNAFSAIMASITSGRKLLDADTLGRAFPTLNISSCALFSMPLSITSMVDSQGNGVCIYTPSPEILEQYARALVAPMGSTASCALYPMTGADAKRVLIQGSVSYAVTIGRLLKRSSSLKSFVTSFCKTTPCRIIGQGVISDIHQEIEDGFLRGSITIKGQRLLKVEFQNEYLAVFENKTPLCTTPDIIVLMENLEPLGSDQIRHGLCVSVLAVACPYLWATEKGLLLTSPKAFGYDFSPVLVGDSL